MAATWRLFRVHEVVGHDMFNAFAAALAPLGDCNAAQLRDATADAMEAADWDAPMGDADDMRRSDALKMCARDYVKNDDSCDIGATCIAPCALAGRHKRTEDLKSCCVERVRDRGGRVGWLESAFLEGWLLERHGVCTIVLENVVDSIREGVEAHVARLKRQHGAKRWRTLRVLVLHHVGGQWRWVSTHPRSGVPTEMSVVPTELLESLLLQQSNNVQRAPVEPKPPSPRAVSSSGSSATSTRGSAAASKMSCATRSPGRTSKASRELLTSRTR